MNEWKFDRISILSQKKEYLSTHEERLINSLSKIPISVWKDN